MKIKQDDISFVVDGDAINHTPQDPKLYRLIHPNLDEYVKHLEYFTQTVNQKKIVKYRVVTDSEKGQFTYDYFKLAELEIDTINESQGLSTSKISEVIEPEIAKRIEELLRKSQK